MGVADGRQADSTRIGCGDPERVGTASRRGAAWRHGQPPGATPDRPRDADRPARRPGRGRVAASLGAMALVLAACGGGGGGVAPGPSGAAAPPQAPAPSPPAASAGDGVEQEKALLQRVDAIMAPAFAPTPADLEQCVGGVAVVVTPTRELVRGYGATALGGTTAPGGTTLFQIGSISKAFTGIAMARLVEEGAFGPGTSVGALLGADLRDAAASWPTVGALISHRSGLPEMPANFVDRDGDGRPDAGIDLRSPGTGYSRADLRSALQGWRAPASAGYRYSNLGIGLVAVGLQDHLGLGGHHATMRRLVTDALGMRDTWGEVDAIPPAALERLATGHVVDGARRVPGIVGRMGVLAGAGEIVTTGEDMLRLLRAVTGREASPLAPAIARATVPLNTGPGPRQIGYAIEIDRQIAGLERFLKGGETTGFSAYLQWSAAPRAGVAVLTACGGFRRVVELAEALHEAARTLP